MKNALESMGNKKKIMFLLKIPPPFTGATYMNSLVFNNQTIDNSFVVYKIGISYSDSVKDLGRFQIKKGFIFLSTLIKFVNYLVTTKPNIIYFQPSITGITYCRDLVIILIGKLFNKKFILHLHGKGIAEACKKNKFIALLYKLGLNKQYLIVLSNNQISDISFLDSKKIFVVPNGIPLLNSLETEKSEIKTTFKFLFLSNLIKSKGVLDVIEAAKHLKNDGYKFNIDIVGAEADVSKSDLLSIIKEYKLEDYVFYHGPKYNQDKIKYFQNADAFVFPTQYAPETFGLVLLEAMQFSLPIIATDESGIPEIVENGRSGYIYNKKDKNCLKNYMAEFINKPQLAKEFGIKGRSIYFEKFTLEAFEKMLLNVFNEALNDL